MYYITDMGEGITASLLFITWHSDVVACASESSAQATCIIGYHMAQTNLSQDRMPLRIFLSLVVFRDLDHIVHVHLLVRTRKLPSAVVMPLMLA